MGDGTIEEVRKNFHFQTGHKDGIKNKTVG
jgi:hypothetical protein